MSKPPTIRDLYPHYSDEELAEAENNLERYLALVHRIFERIEAEEEQKAANIRKFDSPQVSADSGDIEW